MRKMADLKIEVFTSNAYPNCPVAVRVTKEVMQENPALEARINWNEMNTSKPEGQRKAKNYDIWVVPTIILTNTKTGQRAGLAGAPSKKKYIEAIYKTLGEPVPGENKDAKSSFADKFKKMFDKK